MDNGIAPPESVAVNILGLLDALHHHYTRMSEDNDTKPVLLAAAQVIVEQQRQLAELRAPRIVAP